MTQEEIFKIKEELANHVVKTTQHVIMLDSTSKLPESGGSGCIIAYRDRCFFITVQHVADKIGKETCIDIGKHDDTGTYLHNVGAMNFIDQYEIIAINTDEPEVKKLKSLDIAYTELKDGFEAFQTETKFGDYLITADKKRIHFSDTDELPNNTDCYSFFGRIKGKPNGMVLEQAETLVLCFKYDCKVGYFERFILNEIITDPEDFQGTSGAPIISETGEIVAFVAGGIPGTNHLYGFSSAELKKFLNIYIDQNPT
jgi:hypothetical protein